MENQNYEYEVSHLRKVIIAISDPAIKKLDKEGLLELIWRIKVSFIHLLTDEELGSIVRETTECESNKLFTMFKN